MKITILGAGAYALGLAYRLSNNENKITVWSKVEEEINILKKTNRNEVKLPNIEMPSKITYTISLKEALKECDIVFIAVAVKYLCSVCNDILPYINEKHIVIASKGIEEESLQFASEIVKSILKTNKLCTISGPSFAKDMASKNIIGLSLAVTGKKTKKCVLQAFNNTNLKLKVTDDFTGVELCGTMKNIVAIASGILDGLKVSESTKAMFLTECINDIRKLIKKMHGRERTILSFSGIGDILLTCTSFSSRNYTYGIMIGKEEKKVILDEYLKNNTVEGIYTLFSIYKIVKLKKIKYPFLDLIYQIVSNQKRPNEIINFLLLRDQ